MSQFFIDNDKYEIETQNGWEDFKGVIKNPSSNKHTFRITTESQREIHCTTDHEFIINNEKVPAYNLSVNDTIETVDGNEKIISIENDFLEDTYDIYESDSKTIYAHGANVSNCDEFAFVRKNIATKFWASIYPTISCLAPGTIILTSNGFEPIDNYFEDRSEGEYFELDNLQVWGKRGIENVSHGYVSPASETYKIRLENGQSVEVTPEHPLYSRRNINDNARMMPAEKLELGMFLRIDRGMNIEGNLEVSPHEIDRHFESNPEYYMNITRRTLDRFIETRGYIIPKWNDHALNLFVQMLNNFNYDYRVSKLGIQIFKCKEKYETQWLTITRIEKSYQDATYDFTVPNTHTFLQNGILGSNTGGKCIITTTPTTDDTLFANMWKLANKTIDDHGNDMEVGVNGFKALKVKWDAHPERDDEYKYDQIRQFGEEYFLREHELEFISEEETLVNPVKLANLESQNPVAKSKGEIRWYKELSKDYIYLIGYDPSLGTGGDYSAIQIYEFPTMVQVGEWMHNKSDVPDQLKILRRILDMFEEAGFEEDNVRWTLENNTVGEAPLVLIDEYGEDNFFGYFMSEPYNPMRKGQRNRFRKGYNTNKESKHTACMRLKSWIEGDKMELRSRPLMEQMQHFVRRGNTYAASTGEHDDLVMSTIIAVRMAMETMKEDDEYLDQLGITGNGDDDEDDDYVPPLPVY